MFKNDPWLMTDRYLKMSGPEGEERLQGSRGERRFSALNPHGNIDFVLPSGGVSEYLGERHFPNLPKRHIH